jgi:hypothetical protein
LITEGIINKAITISTITNQGLELLQFCICVFFSYGMSICFDNKLSGSVCR